MTINSCQVLINPMQRKVHSTTIAKYLLPLAFNIAPPTPTKIRKKGNIKRHFNIFDLSTLITSYFYSYTYQSFKIMKDLEVSHMLPM